MKLILVVALLSFSFSGAYGSDLFKGFPKGLEGTTSEAFKQLKLDIERKGITVRDGPDNPVGAILPQPGISTICPDGRALPGNTCVVSTPFDQANERLAIEIDPRIVGGLPANIEEFPWQVILIAGGTPADIRSPFCGGSIVGYQWILTAAHCLAGIRQPKDVEVVAGSTFPKYPRQGDRVNVAEIFAHPSYNPSTFEHDIALLKLERVVKRGKRIKFADETLRPEKGTLATVTGWGAVTAYGPMVEHLMRANLPIIPNDVCKQSESYGASIKDGMLCAGEREGGLDACQGDSGGPLIISVKGEPVQVGVVSWGKGCALRLKYGVYTRVSNYNGWISQTISSATVSRR